MPDKVIDLFFEYAKGLKREDIEDIVDYKGLWYSVDDFENDCIVKV